MIRRSATRFIIAWLVAAFAAAEPKPLLKNSGFEKTITLRGVARTGGKWRGWVLRRGPYMPADWTLSSHFIGSLTILTDGPAEGKRYIRIQAGDVREAHVFQLCPAIKPRSAYRLSLRYRGGPVLLKAYEYTAKGGSPHIETIATGPGTKLDGEWARVEGFYYPFRIAKAAIVAAVATGCTADIDDFRVWAVKPKGSHDARGWLNARDFGASGSDFQTTAKAVAGSNVIEVKDVGDFKAGQWVSVSKCNVRYEDASLYGPKNLYGSRRPLGDALEIRGYDGSQGSWLIYIIEIDSANPLTFRWSDNLVRKRKWNATKVPITRGWQKLSKGVEVKFNKRDLQPGHMITFAARDQLVTQIVKVDGRKLILKDKANRTVSDAIVRHNDTVPLQTAIDIAIRQQRNLFVPNGHYRLFQGLRVRDAEIVIEGESGVNTVMDITEGKGAVFTLYRGFEVTIRNFRIVGHTGLADKPGSFRNSTGYPFWACALKPCQAVRIYATERVLIENVHATRMSAEAFYCQGPRRKGPLDEPPLYTKQLTFLRCSAIDCAANAFNNNDMSENTCVLYCRIDGAGWYAYEGPARFIKLVGNYVRNSGGLRVGNCSSRPEYLNQLGCGQAIIANNVFEGCAGRNGGISLGHGPTQVTVANNLFINFNGAAIRVSGQCARQVDRASLPARNAVITGNIIDLTYRGENPWSRCGIEISASDVIAADNQIYVRGEQQPSVVGIKIVEPARNVTVHDNLIRNCQRGLYAARLQSSVRKVIDARTFLETRLPLVWPMSHCYRGWDILWTSGAAKGRLARLEGYDPKTIAFRLARPQPLHVGDRFEIIPADGANWRIHDNTIADCAEPVVLDAYGADTCVFRNNLVTRGAAKRVKQAILVAGRFKLIGNHIVGFDEPGSAALTLAADRARRGYRLLISDNIFERCAAIVKETEKGLWGRAVKRGNVFIGCPGAPTQAGGRDESSRIEATLVEPPKKPGFIAPRLAAPVRIDGDVSEWPWNDKTRVVEMNRDPGGAPVASPQGWACAAYDDEALYLAMRFRLPRGAKIEAAPGFDAGDGVEVSFQHPGPKHATPILLLWGSAGGTHESSTAMGASPRQADALAKATTYAAKRTSDGWSCEWRIPFAAMGLKASDVKALLFNIGMQCTANAAWIAWTPTGGRLCDVAAAGALVLKRR